MDPLDGSASSHRGDSALPASDSKPDGGMQVPKGIEEVAHAVPSSIPPSLFNRPAEVPRPAPKARPPLPPRASKPSIIVAPRVEASDQNERATIEVTVPEVFSKREEEAPPPKVEATPPLRRRDPSSFPLSEKTLVLGSAIGAPPVPESPPSPPEPLVARPVPLEVAGPSSLGAVVTYAPELAEKAQARSEVADDFDLARPTLPSLHRRRRKRVKRSVVAALFVSVVSAAAVVVGIAYAPAPRPPSRVLASSLAARKPADPAPLPPSASATPVRSSSVSANASPPPLPAPPQPAATVSETKSAPETGVVKTEGATPGRRIFVDQRTAGQTPEAITVRCGLRRIRVGSSGKTLTLDVPCGGEVTVSDR